METWKKKKGWLGSSTFEFIARQVWWKWVEEEDFSKLLGTSFDLNLKTLDVDLFLFNKIPKKLNYYRYESHHG